MTSIVFLKEAIYCNIFRCNYLKNEKYFLNFFFFFVFFKFRFKFEIFQKKMTITTDLFLNLQTPKKVVR